MSDEGDVADDAAGDSGAVVTKAVARPQRPTGKRSRVRAAEAEDGDESTDVEVAEKDSAKKDASKSSKASKAKSTQKDKAKKPNKAGSTSSINPFVFVYTYLKQVVAEMRKVIWPNRKQMLTYTSVVLVFLAFMVAVVGGADLGLSKLVLLVFG